MSIPKWLLRDLVEERAAIIEEGEKCSTLVARHAAAKAYGFASWRDYKRAVDSRT